MLKILKLQKSSAKLSLNIFVSIVLSIFLTALIVSTAIYLNFDNIVLSQVFNSIKDNLTQSSYSSKIMIDIAKTAAMQVYFDSQIQKLINYANPNEFDINNGLAQLDIYRLNVPYIDSIYVYNDKNKTFYITKPSYANMIQRSDVFFDKQVVDILDNNEKYLRNVPIPRIIPKTLYDDSGVRPSNVYTFLFNNSNANTSSPPSTVVVNISTMWMQGIYDSLNINPNSSTMIISSEGKMIISNSKYPMLSDVSKQNYITKILDSKNSSGYFLCDIDGTKSIVAYVYSASVKWYYVQVIPYNSVVRDIKVMRIKTIIIIIVLLFFCLLFAIIVASRYFKPINHMVNKLNVLEEKERTSFHMLKQENLKKMVLNSDEYGLESIYNLFEKYNIQLDPDNYFAVVLFIIDDYAEFCDKFNHEDRNVYKYGIMNISTEVLNSTFQAEAISLDESHILMLMNPNDYDHYQMDVEELIKKIQDLVDVHLAISLTAVITSITDQISKINELYHAALSCAKYKIIYGKKSLINTNKIIRKNINDFSYSLEIEKKLIDLMKLSKTKEVYKLYKEITNDALNYSFEAFSVTIMRLALAIHAVVDTINVNSNSVLAYDPNVFIMKINKLESIDKIDYLFLELFESITTEMEENKQPKHDAIIQNVTDIIQDKYNNQDFSIQIISETINMSQAYLGRLYKKLTGTSIPDKINEVRMHKARELLDTTDCSITEIAEKVGFTNDQYFYKVFKKFHGVTPNNYRQRLNPNSQNSTLDV